MQGAEDRIRPCPKGPRLWAEHIPSCPSDVVRTVRWELEKTHPDPTGWFPGEGGERLAGWSRRRSLLNAECPEPVVSPGLLGRLSPRRGAAPNSCRHSDCICCSSGPTFTGSGRQMCQSTRPGFSRKGVRCPVAEAFLLGGERALSPGVPSVQGGPRPTLPAQLEERCGWW